MRRRAEVANTPVRRATKAAQTRTPHGKRVKSEGTLRDRYGISAHDWALMYEGQDGHCPGCGQRLAFDRATHVDHDHATGTVRGLLCRGCNIKVGVLESAPSVIAALRGYLAGAA